MRQISCPICGARNTLQQGAAPEAYHCRACGTSLPPDRILPCPHCDTENAITHDARPSDWQCWYCSRLLADRPSMQGEAGAAVLGALGGAALGARFGGPAGALIGAMVGGIVTGGRSGFETGRQLEDASSVLADWIRANYPYRDPLTHIKLHTLAFYCFGIALAFEWEQPIRGISFQPWNHGPICRPQWERFKSWGIGELPPGPCRVHGPQLPPLLAHLLMDVLTIYGALDLRSLLLQVRLEKPYQTAYAAKRSIIARDTLKSHFYALYRRGRVTPPANLFDVGSFSLDGITVYRFRDIHELAQALRS